MCNCASGSGLNSGSGSGCSAFGCLNFHFPTLMRIQNNTFTKSQTLQLTFHIHKQHSFMIMTVIRSSEIDRERRRRTSDEREIMRLKQSKAKSIDIYGIFRQRFSPCARYLSYTNYLCCSLAVWGLLLHDRIKNCARIKIKTIKFSTNKILYHII